MTTLLKAWLGRNGILAASIAAVIALVMAWDSGRVETGKKLARAEQVEKGVELNAKALAAHQRSERPGAAQRLLERYCRDC